MPSATFCAPIWVLSGVSAGSAFGVSCARNACFIDRCTAAEDLSFWTRRMAYCMSREYLLRAPSRKHDVDFTTLSFENEPLRSRGLRPPCSLSAHELNTGTGAFAPPPRPFFGAARDNPDCGLPASVPGYPPVNLPTAGAPPWSDRPFSPDSLPPSDWTAIGEPPQSEAAGGGGRSPRGPGPQAPPFRGQSSPFGTVMSATADKNTAP